ncbi:PREDICTED: E3 ubiquitin-protein ligase MARCH11 [Tinamus guttatus]|uniref:E3 ubiquitin-protein ligase MARCH11 n=1 Tax=Tinamus guttatus TaxID=94827 RepID=UPI00052E778E|nr:PREDICTED: E3 ubiquitin-protein ligase MARCH11 [Tinamus guttatus]
MVALSQQALLVRVVSFLSQAAACRGGDAVPSPRFQQCPRAASPRCLAARRPACRRGPVVLPAERPALPGVAEFPQDAAVLFSCEKLQYPLQGELLNPCRCDGSVRYTHQLCLLKWISERGSWTCELCCYRYHVIAIKMKKPCQWQSITITLVEKVQMVAVILGSLFLVASVTWLLWSAFSPYAVWQRKDILFLIVTSLFAVKMVPSDILCKLIILFLISGLIMHEGASVYRVFKRWRAVNLHWDVLNYDKATDIEESNRGESSAGLPLTAFRNRSLVHPTQLTSPRFQCGYVLLHLFNRVRPQEDASEDNSSGEVVMRVTSV